MGKLPLLIVLIWTYCTACWGCEGPRHNAQYGQRINADTLDYMDHIKADFRFLRVTERTVIYPPSNEDTGSKLINYIEVIDQYTDGNGGCPSLLTGGPGYNYTTIKLTSKRNHGLDFIVRIFVSSYV